MPLCRVPHNKNQRMLVFGTANPVPYGDNQYNGLFLTDKDMDGMVGQMQGIPVKIEHKGVDVGKVVSAWRHEGRMDLLFELHDSTSLEAALAKQFVKDGWCKDLSLGYKVNMSANSLGQLQASNKRVVEVSIVKTGARENCHIRGWSNNNNHKILV